MKIATILPALRRILIVLACCGLAAGCKKSEYDKAAFDQLQQKIDSGSDKLTGQSVEDAIREFSLAGVRWDEGFSPDPMSQIRIYHFDGYYLLLNLRAVPAFPSPADTNVTGKTAGKAQTKWFVSDTFPALHVDAIKDPSVRMSNYWAGVEAAFRMRASATNDSGTKSKQ